LLKFKSDFKNFIDKLAEEPGIKLDLEKILDEVYTTNKANKELITEINTTIETTLKTILKGKITGKIKNKLSVLDIGRLITTVEVYPLTDNSIKGLINRTLGTSNPEILRI
jgi:hypothetical protein